MIEALPAFGDPNSPIQAGPAPWDIPVLEIPTPFHVVYEYGKERVVVARYRRRQVANQIAQGLGPDFRVRKVPR